VDAVGGDIAGQVTHGQELPPHIDEGQPLRHGQRRHRIGVQLLMAVDAPHVPQPAQDAAAVRAPGDELEIPLAVDGRQRHQHRLHTGGRQFLHRTAQLFDELRQHRVGQVLLLRGGSDGLPVEVAVVAAVGHQRPAGVHAALHVVLHQRQTLCHRGAHFGAVHHLQPVGGVLRHHLRQVEPVMHVLVRHRGLQQGISVNKRTLHNERLLASFYIIYHIRTRTSIYFLALFVALCADL